jgi:arylformamidase
MKIYDISWPISPAMTSYKDQYPVSITTLKEFEKDGVRLSSIHCSNHSGTHVDAPSHFLKDGIAIDAMPLESLCGHAVVLDCTDLAEKITTTDLAACEEKIKENSFILFKTKNSFLKNDAPFDFNFIYLEQSAAQFLASKKIKGIGFDYLGIERAQKHHETHIFLMQNNVTIVEGLRLANINPGQYQFFAMPLLINGSDGAPARAFLIEDYKP